MSRRLSRAPFALASDGSLLVNVATLTNATDIESVVRAAQDEKRAVFIGVIMSPEETTFAMARLDNAADEAAAGIVGERRRSRRTAAKRT